MDHPLRAPLEIEFDYTRSLGPVLSQFMTGLRDRRILGARGADGRVHAPPFEYDPVSAEPPGELTEVGSEGTVVSWSWMPEPLEGQPLDGPFAWALIRLDGADTAMLHAVDAGPGMGAAAAVMRTGLRVRARWAASRVGSIRDIACFEPCDSSAPVIGEPDDGDEAQVGMTVTPVRLHYEHTASPGESAYLRGLADRRLLGQRCGVCGRVYVPPRGTCPVDGVPTREEVELPETGTVTTFCVVNVAYPGQRVTPPYVAAAVLLDGADIAFQHLILGCEPGEVRMGLRVRAVWGDAGTISHFAPAGEPDAAVRELREVPVTSPAAVVGFAQAPCRVRPDVTTSGVEMLVPIFAEVLQATGLTKADIGFWCSGSSDYLAGRAFSFVQAVDAIGAVPPTMESHVEMDAAWALYEAWVKVLTGEAEIALAYGFGKSSGARAAAGAGPAARPVPARAAVAGLGVGRGAAGPARPGRRAVDREGHGGGGRAQPGGCFG